MFDDIDRGEMIVAVVGHMVAGYVTVNEDIPDEYNDVDLQFASKICIHRLSINPQFSRQGVATKIMEFVHKYYRGKGHKSICLDTCEANVAALKLYEKFGYITRGYVKFSRREQYRFPVMEIML